MPAQMLQILERAGDEIVQAHHFVPVRQQPVAQMRADESGRSGYEMPQLVSPQNILSVHGGGPPGGPKTRETGPVLYDRGMVLSDIDIRRYIEEGKIKISPALAPEQFGSCS